MTRASSAPPQPFSPVHSRRPRRWSFIVWPAFVAALGLMAAGCSRPTAEDLGASPFPPVEDAEVEAREGEGDPIASPEAVRGGVFDTWAGGYPKSLNYWTDQNSFSGQIMGLMYESLVGLHPVEDRWVGELASEWTRDEDDMEFTITIDEAATWSDGAPVTADDVIFYYDTIMNPENLTTVFRVSVGRLNRPEAIDEKTLKITAKEKHFLNWSSAGGLTAFPKHYWEGKDFNDINFDGFEVVSGPYKLHDVAHNRSITLQRRGDWWGRVKPENEFIYNFDYLRFLALEDRTLALEKFKQGEMDLYPIYTSALWAQQTDFEAVQKNWVVRQEVYNKEPLGFQGFAMNMRREKFQDKRVREALSYLLNRETINEKIMFNAYFLLNSYYPDLFDDNTNPEAKMYSYNPDRARQLLEEAGWTVNDEGKLEKDGKPLSITFLHSGPDLPHYNVYREDLERVGIQARIEKLDMATIRKRLQELDFDMSWQAWGASRIRDPEPIWHSAQADQKNTNNIPGVEDEQVDALIEQYRTEMDLARRNDLLRQIDTRLTEIVPYVLLWQSDRDRLLYWNRYGTPEYVLNKFGNEQAALAYWWVDPEKDAALEEAQANGTALPDEPDVVRYQAAATGTESGS